MTLAVLDRLTAMDPRLRGVARRQAGARVDLADDLAQEARIAVWRALEKRPDVEDAYLIAAAYSATTKVATGRSMTGAPSRKGKRADVLDVEHDSLDFTYDDGDPIIDVPDPTSLEALNAVEWHCHAPEVAAVLTTLPEHDRAYVIGVFYLGMTGKDVAAHLGVPYSSMHRRFKTFTTPALSTALAHLADAA